MSSAMRLSIPTAFFFSNMVMPSGIWLLSAENERALSPEVQLTEIFSDAARDRGETSDTGDWSSKAPAAIR